MPFVFSKERVSYMGVLIDIKELRGDRVLKHCKGGEYILQ
jgi:hypothetical protein